MQNIRELGDELFLTLFGAAANFKSFDEAEFARELLKLREPYGLCMQDVTREARRQRFLAKLDDAEDLTELKAVVSSLINTLL